MRELGAMRLRCIKAITTTAAAAVAIAGADNDAHLPPPTTLSLRVFGWRVVCRCRSDRTNPPPITHHPPLTTSTTLTPHPPNQAGAWRAGADQSEQDEGDIYKAGSRYFGWEVYSHGS